MTTTKQHEEGYAHFPIPTEEIARLLAEQERRDRLPQIGDTCHYVHPMSVGVGRCVAAIVTEMADQTRGYVTVREMHELHLRHTRHSEGGEMYTWHWSDECPHHNKGREGDTSRC